MKTADSARSRFDEICMWTASMAAPGCRLVVTPSARALIARLRRTHGSLMFHQACGEHDEGLPLCFAQGDFPLVEMDVLLGTIDGAPFYVSHRQYRSFAHAQVRLDAVAGRAGVFSLERPTGLRFTTHTQPLRQVEMRTPPRAKSRRPAGAC